MSAMENSAMENSNANKAVEGAMARKTPTYSASPAASINLARLTSTRFIVTTERKYPFRDVLGRVNLHLVNSSLAEAEADGDTPSCDRLRAWQRHAVRNLSKRPADELITLEELAEFDLDEGEVESVMPTPLRKTPGTEPGMRRRLFRAPQPHDEPLFDDSPEPEVDHLYRCRLADEGERKEARAAASALTRQASSDSSGESDDIWEVEAILDEDVLGGKGFLIRWAGFSPEHDSWEPEWNVAPHLVADFRKERALTLSHRGDDYLLGRKRLLWCSACGLHRAADSFSSNQRRSVPAARSCLLHHYKSETGAPTPKRGGRDAASSASPSAATATPARLSGQKRPRTAERDAPPPSGLRPPASSSARPTPNAPYKAARPVARALSQRQAALEMRTARLFGFGAF